MADLSKYKAVDMEMSVRTSNMIRHLWGDQITLADLDNMSLEELNKSFGTRGRREILDVITCAKVWPDPEPTRDQRIADLLEANNRYLQRARDAEAKLAKMAHATNEFADAFYNAQDGVRNIRDGISTPDEVLENLKACHEHCQAVWAEARS